MGSMNTTPNGCYVNLSSARANQDSMRSGRDQGRMLLLEPPMEHWMEQRKNCSPPPFLDSSKGCSPGRGLKSSDPDKDMYIMLDPDKFPAPHLANIEEDYPLFPKPFPAPETPQELMEFLSRSWSIPSVDVARHVGYVIKAIEAGPHHTSLEEPTLETAPFTFASNLTSQLVVDRLMAPTSVSSAIQLLVVLRIVQLYKWNLTFLKALSGSRILQALIKVTPTVCPQPIVVLVLVTYVKWFTYGNGTSCFVL